MQARLVALRRLPIALQTRHLVVPEQWVLRGGSLILLASFVSPASLRATFSPRGQAHLLEPSSQALARKDESRNNCGLELWRVLPNMVRLPPVHLVHRILYEGMRRES